MKTVCITGASSGIGAACAEYFAKRDYRVLAVCDRNIEALQDLADSLTKKGYTCLASQLDITDHTAVEDYFAACFHNNLFPDLILNNAGISVVGLLQDLSEAEWNRIVSVNLSGLYHVCHAAIPYLLERGGAILNVSSMWGNVGASCEVAYSATKGGVNAFTRALAKELAPSAIPVNAVAFGCVDTAMNHFLSAEDKKDLANNIPAGYFLSPEDAAQILYTVSTLHPYVTGQIITADGGYT